MPTTSSFQRIGSIRAFAGACATSPFDGVAGDLLRLETLEAGRRHLRAPVVVEHRVDRLGVAGELSKRPDPLIQLLLRVEVVEALRGAPGALVPGARVAAVEAHIGRLARPGDDGRDEVLRLGLRCVDDHVGEPARLEERERLCAVLLVEPAAVTKLDQDLVPGELGLRPFDVLERGGLVDDVRRELQQDAAELPALAQRLDGAGEPAEHLGAELAWRAVDTAARVDRHRVAQVLGQRFELDGVAGHQAERLHVHREARRSALGPVADELRVGQPVVGRVRLDRVEALGVVADPRFARADATRVPDLRQRLVCPRAGADPDRRGHGRIVRNGRRPGRAQAAGIVGALGADHGQRACEPHAAAAFDIRLDRDG